MIATHRHALAILSLTALLPASRQAGAQAPGRPPPADSAERDAWKIGAELGFNFASGNTSFAIWHSAVRVARNPTEVAEFEWTASVDYGRSRGVLAENHIASSAKFDYLPQRTISPFTFVNAEQDEVRKIDLQAYGGAGLKYTFWKTDAGKASISGALVYNYETFTTSRLTLVARPSEQTARWSMRFKGNYKFGPALELENTTFFQPVLSDVGDYNISAASSLVSKATSRISLFLRYLYRRDSTPGEEVQPVDQRVSGGLRFEF